MTQSIVAPGYDVGQKALHCIQVPIALPELKAGLIK
jgi:hypothetical protein